MGGEWGRDTHITHGGRVREREGRRISLSLPLGREGKGIYTYICKYMHRYINAHNTGRGSYSPSLPSSRLRIHAHTHAHTHAKYRGPVNFGICANNLAYFLGISESIYALASAGWNTRKWNENQNTGGLRILEHVPTIIAYSPGISESVYALASAATKNRK